MTSDQIVKARARLREEFELVAKLGARADIDSAMLHVDALLTLADEASSSAVREDAARYRWLREQAGSLKIADDAGGYLFRLYGEFNPTQGFFDDTIDAARAPQEGPDRG
jgi:hypothetical protein